LYNINASNYPEQIVRSTSSNKYAEPNIGSVFLSENSPSSYDLTTLSQSNNFFDYKNDVVKKRKFRHLKRFGFLMKEYDIKAVSMLTLTVQFDGSYETSKEYDCALSRIRRTFNYYGISKITGSEFTKKGVKHYHIIFNSNSIIKICSSKSFKRFVKSYKFTDDDFKAIFSKKRSYLEIYIARWFATRWRLGFADFMLEAKALYLLKYVNESYNDEVSLHGRVSYSRQYSSWFHSVSSLVVCGYNNSVVPYKQKFYFPVLFIEDLQKENRLKYLSLSRLIALYRFYQSRIDYLRSRKYLTISELKQLDYYAERLGLLLGY
jgi:hypothetical protein